MRFLIFFGCPQLSAFQRAIVLPNQLCLANAESFILEASRLQSKKPTKSPDKKRKIEKAKTKSPSTKCILSKKKTHKIPRSDKKRKREPNRQRAERGHSRVSLSQQPLRIFSNFSFLLRFFLVYKKTIAQRTSNHFVSLHCRIRTTDNQHTQQTPRPLAFRSPSVFLLFRDYILSVKKKLFQIYFKKKVVWVENDPKNKWNKPKWRETKIVRRWDDGPDT